MKIQNKVLLTLLLIGIIFLSGCSQEKFGCIKSGGKWRGFSNTCVDSCEYIKNEIQVCGQILTQGCDCGLEMCWNGISCEPN